MRLDSHVGIRMYDSYIVDCWYLVLDIPFFEISFPSLPPSLLSSIFPSLHPLFFFLLSILREDFSLLCLPNAGITDMLYKLFVLDLQYVAITFNLPCP